MIAYIGPIGVHYKYSSAALPPFCLLRPSPFSQLYPPFLSHFCRLPLTPPPLFLRLQQVAAQAFQSTKRLALSPDLTVNIFKEGGPLALTEVDEGSVGLRAYMASSEAQVDTYREGAGGVMRLMEQVDGEMGAAKQRAMAAAEDRKSVV